MRKNISCVLERHHSQIYMRENIGCALPKAQIKGIQYSDFMFTKLHVET